MISIEGELYDGKSSAHWRARLSAHHGGRLQLQWGEDDVSYPLDGIEISSRLGNTPRYFTLPDGRKFETGDNDAVDALVAQHSKRELHGRQALLHRLESRMHYVLLALVAVVAFSWGMLKYGLPAAAEGIAYALPQDIMRSASDSTIKVLDENYLSPTRLDEAQRQRLQSRFIALSRQAEPGFNYQLLFRQGGEMLGANAFALPSGTIIVTDELVEVAGNDEEVIAVLAHELGHVVNRHSLRQVLQSSALSLLVTYATGDVSSILVGLPVLFVELGYSRRFEHQADQFAYDFLQRNQIPLHHFADILEGLERSHTRRRAERSKREGEGSRVVELFEYLSTHPSTAERVERFRNEIAD